MMATGEGSSHVAKALLSHTHTNEKLIQEIGVLWNQHYLCFHKSLNFKLGARSGILTVGMYYNLICYCQFNSFFGKFRTRNEGTEEEDTRIGCKGLHRKDKGSYGRDKIFFLYMSTLAALWQLFASLMFCLSGKKDIFSLLRLDTKNFSVV